LLILVFEERWVGVTAAENLIKTFPLSRIAGAVLFLVHFLSLAGVLHAEEETLVVPEVIVEEETTEEPSNPVVALPVQIIRIDNLPAGCNDVGEALRSVTGVKLTEFGSSGHGSVIMLRGGGSQQLMVLRDGVPLSSALGGGPDLSAIPLSSVERIEVYRGSMGTWFGSSAMSGAVNIVSREPGSIRSGIEITAGSFGLDRERLSHSDTMYRVDVERFSTEGDFAYRSVNGRKRTRRNNAATRDEVSFAGSFRGGGYRIRHMRMDREEPGLAEFPSLLADSESFMTSVDVDLSQGFIGSGWKGKTFLSSREFEFRDPDPFLGEPIDTDQDYLDLGFSLKRELYLGQEDVFTPTFFVRRESLSDSEYDDPERTTLQTGLTWERIYGGGTWSAGILGENASDFGEALAIRAGWEGDVGRRLTGFISAGRGFRIPAFNELYYPEQGFMGGNPELRKEVSLDTQAGIRIDDYPWKGSLTLFNARYGESILFVPVSAYRIQPINTGAARVRGLEMEFSRSKAGGEGFGGNFTWQDPILLSTGKRLIGRPRLKGSVWLSDRFGSLDVRLTHDYEGSLFTDMFANQSVKPKHSTNVFVETKTGEWVFSADARNIFNNNLRDTRDLPLPGRSFFVSVSKEF
jgi:outer membrane cobalamin receptor